MGAAGEEKLPFNQRQIEQPRFVYFPLGKSFEKQTEKKEDAMLSTVKRHTWETFINRKSW